MSTNDEKIQRMLEAMEKEAGEQTPLDLDPPFREDVKLYQLLFDELKNLPEAATLSPDFARNITSVLAASGKPAKKDRGELVLVVALSVAGLLLAVSMIGWIGTDAVPLTSFATPGMLFLSVFVLACFVTLQSLESRLLRKKYS
nr:hypothetical protein [uncultured Chitinophaga sp.]